MYFKYRCAGSSDPDVARRCRIPMFKAKQVDTVVWNWIKSILLDEEKLNQGFENYKKDQEEQNSPIINQLEITKDLIAQQEKDLENKITNLDTVFSQRAKARLAKEIAQIEQALDRLELQKSELEARLQLETLTPEQIANVKAFAAKIRAGLLESDVNFEARREIVDLLDVRVICRVEDDNKVLDVECHIGQDISVQCETHQPWSVMA